MNTKVNQYQNRNRNRIDRICEAVSAWLDNEDGLLKRARDRTIAEGLFRPHDVDHMLGQIRQTVTRQTLTGWLERVCKEGGTQGSRAGSQHQSDSRKDANAQKADNTQHDAHPIDGSTRPKTLCLHAGNLPMVGLQDIIAVLLAGSIYYGKLSRNDPWLPDSLLQIIRQRMPDQAGRWSTRMEELEGIKAGRVLFAGSEASVDAVIRRVHELKLATETARFLPRTARLSMAWLTEEDFKADEAVQKEEHPPEQDISTSKAGRPKKTGAAGNAQSSAGGSQPASEGELYKQLVEAMLRYDGKGCRSVAVVISAREWSDCAGPLMDALEAWLRDHPPGSDEKPGVRYWKNYLRAVDKEVYETGGHLITSEPDLMGKEGVICWLKGDEKEVARLAGHFGSQLQSVYVTRRMLMELSDKRKSSPINAEHPAGGSHRTGPINTEYSVGGSYHTGSINAEKSVAGNHRTGPINTEYSAAGSHHAGSINAEHPVSGSPGIDEPRHATIRFEPLDQAQSPPIDWRPDGTDVLRWLLFG